MATVRTATFLGVDITDRVVSWGTLEQVKEVLLAEATMFTSEHSIQVMNEGGAFTSDGPASIVRGLNWYGQILTVTLDGQLVYAGRVRNIQISSDAGTATIVSDDVMKVPAQEPFVGSGQNANPGDVLLAIARSALPEEFIDAASFKASGGLARTAGATISYEFKDDSRASCMSAMQEIARLCSISVYVSRTLLSARVFRPYQGQGSGLKQDIDETVIRAMPSQGYDALSFVNRVTVGYTGGFTETVNALDSQRANRIIRPITYGDTETVFAYDRASAIYFGNLCLSRSSYQRRICEVTIGPTMNPVDMGDRFPVTSSRFGLVAMPAEVIEAHRNPDQDEVTLKLAELYDPHIPPLFPVLNTPRFVFGAPSPYGAIVLANAPALWQGDREDTGTVAADLSGNHRDGAYVGGPLLNQTALVNDPTGYPTSSSFRAAAGKYTRIPNAAWMNVGTAMTLINWISLPGVNGAHDRYLIGCAELSLATGFAMYNFIGETRLATLYHTTAGGNHIERLGAGDITTGDKTMIAMTYDGLRVRAYIGRPSTGLVLDFAGAAHGSPEPINAATQDFCVGSYPDAAGAESDGLHEDGILYSGLCMSLAQLAAIYNAGK